MKKIVFVVIGLQLSIFGFSRTLASAVPETDTNYNSIHQGGLIDIFRQTEAKFLLEKNEKKLAEYLRRQNNTMIKYIALHYPDMPELEMVDANDPAATWFCLLFALSEANHFAPFDPATGTFVTAKGVPSWLSCTLGVVGVSYGVTELITSLGNFTIGSAWKVAKFIVKKYVLGWLGTAVALYEVATTCF